jgi:F-type H+-transporting ATPase subunit epsilon
MSEAQMINFELVSPDEKLISEPVRMAVIPGDEGEFGIGAGPAALVASLKPGVVQLYMEGQDEPRRVFITGGFADVTGEICTILAETAVDVANLNEDELNQQLANLNEDLGLAEGAVDKARIEKRITLVKAQLSAVKGSLVL